MKHDRLQKTPFCYSLRYFYVGCVNKRHFQSSGCIMERHIGNGDNLLSTYWTINNSSNK